MKAKFYYLLRNVFDQKTRNKLKMVKYDLEKKLRPLKEKRYGNFSSQDLKRALEKKLPVEFDILMVHSSYNTMLPMYKGSPRELLELLLSICGPEKTLVMPAFFFGGRAYNYNIRQYFTDKPTFYVDKMPSQMGVLTEIFRNYPGVKVSRHPTHRITAYGPKADYLTADHELCLTGCGKGSPFDKMSHGNTLILGVGVRYFHCMTQTHSAEDVLIEEDRYPTKFDSIQIPVTLQCGGDKSFSYSLLYPDKSAYRRKLHPMVRKILDKEDLFEWRYSGVDLFYARARSVQEKLIAAAISGHSAYHK